MKNLLIVIMLLVCVFPAVAGESEVPVFTDKDLEKYKSGDEYVPESRTTQKEQRKRTEQGPATYEVPYEPTAGSAKKIIIPVTVNNALTVPMLLDTGSTGMYISAKLAEALGILKRGEGNVSVSVMGAGGKTPVILTVIDTVQVGEAKDEFIPTFVEVKKAKNEGVAGRAAETVFAGFEGVIGMDFMSKYSIRIDAGRHVIVLVTVPPDPERPGGHDEEWWRGTFHMFASVRSDWKNYRDALSRIKEETVILRELRERADRQYKEADRLMRKLNNYAVDKVVPMEWREY